MPEEQHSTPSASPGGRESLEGWKPELQSAEDVAHALALALDFRGDVTVTTTDGRAICGYVFNCVTRKTAPYLEMYPKGEDEVVRLPYSAVADLAFANFDPAAGRSWETWVKKYGEKKKALAEGRDVGNIEPDLMPLDD
jgi:hypothetical protein